MKILGKCPVCGADIASGKYGPYCTGKCGFKIRINMYGRELTENQVADLLDGKAIVLENMFSTYSFAEYDLKLKPSGIKEFSYVGKNGIERNGYEWTFWTEYL